MRPQLQGLGLTLVVVCSVTCGDRSNRPGASISPALEASLRGPHLGARASAAHQPLRFDRAQHQFVGVGVEERFEVRLGVDTAEVSIRRRNARAGLTLTPVSGAFKFERGVLRGGAVVYPSQDAAALVLTPGPRGVKEDIVVTRPVADELSFEWELKLEPGLEARLDPDGSVRIWGPAHSLLYRLPAPVVHDRAGAEVSSGMRFELKNTRLRLVATGLLALDYPISIDPTVVITTTAEFALGGNNESGVDIGAGQVTRGRPTAGRGAWAATTNLPSARQLHASVAYNGFYYLLGGNSLGTNLSDVWVAPINANGTLGAWAATTGLPTARYGHRSLAYNGYLYVVGGDNAGVLNDVQVARINANGTLGAWVATTPLTSGRVSHTSVAYDGFLYVLGGSNGVGTDYNDVQVAPINPNGTLGAWTATTSFSTVRATHASVAYRGFLYVVGGQNGGTRLGDVQAAPINPSGTVGAWVTIATLPTARGGLSMVASNGSLYIVGGEDGSSSNQVLVAPILPNGTLAPWLLTTVPTGRYRHTSVAHDGFLYVAGGISGGQLDDVQVAPITANGTLGSTLGGWAAATSFPTARRGQTSVAYNGFLYLIGGLGDPSNYLDEVRMAPINPNGTLGGWTATTGFVVGRYLHTSVAFNGFLYVIGGRVSNTGYRNDVQVAPINADGTLGTWTPTTSLPGARYSHASVVYNGSLYVLGGFNGASLDEVLVAPINANGTLGMWATTTGLTTARSGHTSVAYNGRLYVLGGYAGGYLNEVLMAPINANGTVGVWATTTGLPTARWAHTSVAYNGSLYVLGGGGSSNLNDVQLAPINATGSLGAWTSTTSFGTARANHASAMYNGSLYILGGFDALAGNSLNDVQQAPLLGPVAVGSYSRLVDVGALEVLGSLTLNGSAPNRGLVGLAYRTAGASGPFGPLVDRGVVPLGAAVDLGGVSARYLWVRLTLDDTGCVTAQTSSLNERDITDLTVSYGGGAGPATRVQFTVQPSNATAGASISPAIQVTVQDASGATVTSSTATVTLSLGANPGGATLSGTTSVAAVAGVATFPGVSLDKAGTGYTLSASSAALTPVASSPFDIVTGGSVTSLAVAGFPSPVTAGTAANLTVTAKLGGGATATGYTGTVTFTSSDPSAVLPANYTFVASDMGSRVFSATLKTAGTRSLTATDTLTGSLTGTQGNVAVTSGPASNLVFSVQPSNASAAAVITPAVQVTLRDTFGNRVGAATADVNLSIGTNPGGGLLAGPTTVAAVAGIATFSNLTIGAPGTGYTLTATSAAVTAAISTPFDITPSTFVDAGSDGGPPDGGPDAGPLDGGQDAGTPDGGQDAGTPDSGEDAGLPDGGQDAGMPDSGSPSSDGGQPDGGQPDGGQPDGGQPDGGQPDGGAPIAGVRPVVGWSCGCSSGSSASADVVGSLLALFLSAAARRRAPRRISASADIAKSHLR